MACRWWRCSCGITRTFWTTFSDVPMYVWSTNLLSNHQLTSGRGRPVFVRANSQQKMKSISSDNHRGEWDTNHQPNGIVTRESVQSLIVVSCLCLSVCADEAEMDRDSTTTANEWAEWTSCNQFPHWEKTPGLNAHVIHLQWRCNWAKVEPLRRKGRWRTRLGDCPRWCGSFPAALNKQLQQIQINSFENLEANLASLCFFTPKCIDRYTRITPFSSHYSCSSLWESHDLFDSKMLMVKHNSPNHPPLQHLIYITGVTRPSSYRSRSELTKSLDVAHLIDHISQHETSNV